MLSGRRYDDCARFLTVGDSKEGRNAVRGENSGYEQEEDILGDSHEPLREVGQDVGNDEKVEEEDV